jgi:NAD+ diphosphatase
MTAALADPSTRVLVVSADQVAGDGDALRLLAPAEAPPGELAYLGQAGGVSYLSAMVEKVPAEMVPRSVREVAATLDTLQGGLLAHATGLAAWHATHPRCSRCGAATIAARGGHVRECPACGAVHFPRTDPVRREVAEEVGIVVGEVTYAASQPWPFPSSLMLGFFASADSVDIGVDGVEIVSARWFTRAGLAAAIAAGDVGLPGSLSISRWLIESWYGEELAGSW